MVFPAKFAFVLDNFIRRYLVNMKGVLKDASLKEGMNVLEIGCGPGFFTPYLAKAAGSGRLYAVDIQQEMINKLAKKIPLNSSNNVITMVGDASSLNIKDNEIDLIFAYYTFHEFADKEKSVKELYRILKKGGMLFIAEPRLEVSREKMDYTIHLFLNAGLRLLCDKPKLFSWHVKMEKF